MGLRFGSVRKKSEKHNHVHEKSRPTIAYERQRNTSYGHKSQIHSNVYRKLDKPGA